MIMTFFKNFINSLLKVLKPYSVETLILQNHYGSCRIYHYKKTREGIEYDFQYSSSGTIVAKDFQGLMKFLGLECKAKSVDELLSTNASITKIT